MTTKSSGLHSRLLSVAFDGSIHRISLLHSKRLPDQTRYHILTIKLKLFFTEFSNIFRLIVPTMYLKVTCIALLALSVGARSQETLSCNDVPDLMAFCETECGDSSLKDVECSATGPSCFCLNAAGDIENTNINAPTLCGGEDLSEACAEECGTVSQIEGFDCENDKPVCTCAKDDGIQGLGDDVSEEDSDYADAKDAEAEKIAAELEENPLPVPPSLTMEDVAAAVAPAATTEVTPAAMAPAASEDAAPSTEPEAPAGSGSMIAGIVTALMVSAAGLVIA
eukprot:jgi/Picre1/32769/NNA_001055.t1